MTTHAQLKKQAIADGFVDSMKELGFNLGPSEFWSYRRRGDYIDYIDFWLNSSKNFVDVPVMCFKSTLIDHCNMSEFPKGFNKNPPFYSSTFINDEYGVEIGSDSWKVTELADVSETFNALFPHIQKEADQWFKAICSDRKLYDSYCVRKKESDDGERLRRLLCGD